MLDFLEKLKTTSLSLPDALELVAKYHAALQARDGLSHIDPLFLHYPPGHYYSPLPSRAELEQVSGRVYGGPLPDELPGVDLRERDQLRLYAKLVPYYAEFPFQEKKNSDLRYYFDNPTFCYADAFWLYAMLRHHKPARVVEIGAGLSSCVILDTWERFLSTPPDLTCIEPDPQRLINNLKNGDENSVTLYKQLVQDVPLELFDTLEAGDFLFIDNSHVGKVGSDVLHILFHILPRIRKGVIIHIHDMFYPFEYPKDWLEKGWAWNEDYFVRAFLQYNESFSILLFGNFLGKKYYNMLMKSTPVCCKNIGGSLWLEKK